MKILIVKKYNFKSTVTCEFKLEESISDLKNVSHVDLLNEIENVKSDIEYTEVGRKLEIIKCSSKRSFTAVLNFIRLVVHDVFDDSLLNSSLIKFTNNKLDFALSFCNKLKNSDNIVLSCNNLEELNLLPHLKCDNSIGKSTNKILNSKNLQSKFNNKQVKFISEISNATDNKSDSVSAEPIKILTFGEFGVDKKVEVVIESVEYLRKKYNLNLEVLILGKDSPNAKGYLESIKNKYHYVNGLTFSEAQTKGNMVELLNNKLAILLFYYMTAKENFGKAVFFRDFHNLSLPYKDQHLKDRFFNPKSITSLALAIQNIIMDDNKYKANFSIAN